MAETQKEKSIQNASERFRMLQNIYIYMCVYVYIYIYMCVCVCVCVCVYKTETSMNGTHEGEFRV